MAAVPRLDITSGKETIGVGELIQLADQLDPHKDPNKDKEVPKHDFNPIPVATKPTSSSSSSGKRAAMAAAAPGDEEKIHIM